MYNGMEYPKPAPSKRMKPVIKTILVFLKFNMQILRVRNDEFVDGYYISTAFLLFGFFYLKEMQDSYPLLECRLQATKQMIPRLDIHRRGVCNE